MLWTHKHDGQQGTNVGSYPEKPGWQPTRMDPDSSHASGASFLVQRRPRNFEEFTEFNLRPEWLAAKLPMEQAADVTSLGCIAAWLLMPEAFWKPACWGPVGVILSVTLRIVLTRLMPAFRCVEVFWVVKRSCDVAGNDARWCPHRLAEPGSGLLLPAHWGDGQRNTRPPQAPGRAGVTAGWVCSCVRKLKLRQKLRSWSHMFEQESGWESTGKVDPNHRYYVILLDTMVAYNGLQTATSFLLRSFWSFSFDTAARWPSYGWIEVCTQRQLREVAQPVILPYLPHRSFAEGTSLWLYNAIKKLNTSTRIWRARNLPHCELSREIWAGREHVMVVTITQWLLPWRNHCEFDHQF